MNRVVRLGVLLILRDKKCAKIQLKAQIKCKLAVGGESTMNCKEMEKKE